MACAQRGADSSVKERLFRECYRFSFFNAVQLLERLAPGKEPLGEALTPGREGVRFRVSPGFSFPASDLCAVHEGEGQSALEVAFFGLIGPSGVLPHWYNELAAERKSQKDGALAAFFDLFHHRLLTLFYLAWKKHRFELNYRPDAGDRFSFYLRSLVGLGTDGVSGKMGLPEESPMYFAGLLSRGVPSADAVCSAVSYYFQVDARIDQFVGRPITLAPEDRTALGRANCRIGEDAICGSQVWESQSRFRLNLGPMPFGTYVTFFPGGDRLKSLFSLVKYQVGPEYEFDVRLVLKKEDVPGCRLGAAGSPAGRLGWSTWVKSPDMVLRSDPYATFEEADVEM
jgi:type VI secretion system protein ImpH